MTAPVPSPHAPPLPSRRGAENAEMASRRPARSGVDRRAARHHACGVAAGALAADRRARPELAGGAGDGAAHRPHVWDAGRLDVRPARVPRRHDAVVQPSRRRLDRLHDRSFGLASRRRYSSARGERSATLSRFSWRSSSRASTSALHEPVIVLCCGVWMVTRSARARATVAVAIRRPRGVLRDRGPQQAVDRRLARRADRSDDPEPPGRPRQAAAVARRRRDRDVPRLLAGARASAWRGPRLSRERHPDLVRICRRDGLGRRRAGLGVHSCRRWRLAVGVWAALTMTETGHDPGSMWGGGAVDRVLLLRLQGRVRARRSQPPRRSSSAALLAGFFAFRWQPRRRPAALIAAAGLLVFALAAAVPAVQQTRLIPRARQGSPFDQIRTVLSSSRRHALIEAGPGRHRGG